MNRKALKKQAREMIKGHLWDLLKPYVVILLISFVVGIIFGASTTGMGVATYNPESPFAGMLSSIISLATVPLSFGVYAYTLNFIRKEPYDIKQLFTIYKKAFVIILLSFLIGLFTFLWLLLFIIPGIIAALSYAMAPYLMADDHNDSMECIKHSKKMMTGYKWDYFKFLFSFIGWILLAIPTLGLILIYVIPYITVANLLYYEELRKITKFD